MKVVVSVTAEFEAEVNDKFASMVDTFDEKLADELLDEINLYAEGKPINFTEVSVMGIMNENGEVLTEWAECDDTELKAE